MKKANLLVTAILAGLGVQAQAVAVPQPNACRPVESVKSAEAGKSWSRVQVKLAKAPNKPAAIKLAQKKPRIPPTCGVRG